MQVLTFANKTEGECIDNIFSKNSSFDFPTRYQTLSLTGLSCPFIDGKEQIYLFDIQSVSFHHYFKQGN